MKYIHTLLISFLIFIVFIQSIVSDCPTCDGICPTGQYLIADNSCTTCTPGYYCNDGKSRVPCSAGTENPSPGSTSPSACTACSTGYYSSSPGTPSCTICPRGSICPNPAQAPDATTCANGRYTPTTGSTTCTNCPAGHYCPDPANDPIPCAKGSYTSGAGAHLQCTNCNPGYYTTGTQSTQCLSCEPGYFCDGTDRTQCSPGTYNPVALATSASACSTCESGYYCEDGIERTGCPPGTYNPSTGKKGSEACLPCPSGYYATGYGSQTCTICPRGSICPNPTTSTTCGTGLYTPSSGSTECSDCPPGYYCPSPNQDPVPCPIGSYSPSAGATTTCQTCSPGTHTPSAGATACTACLPGTFCPNGIEMNTCSSGSFSDVSETSCQTCAGGFSCPSTSSSPIQCSRGTYSPAGDTDCHTCPAGTYASTDGALSCSPCLAGHQCQNPTIDPVPCPAGTRAESNGQGCTSCDPGYYSSAASSTCSICDAGSYCPNTNGAPILCPKGSISSPGQTDCTSCQAGEYSNAAGTVCLACDIGHQCSDPTLGPVKCSPGTYANSQGSTECTPCPAGKYCSDPTVPPVDCVNGWSQLGSHECFSCPYNKDCTNHAALPVDCPSGEFSPEGVDTCAPCPAGTQCFPTIQTCPTGYYSLEGDVSCTECPSGYSCSNSAPPSACTAGTYSLAGSMTCNLCPAGYYCPSADQLPIACPDGYYSVGGSVTSCSACSAGFYCPDKTVSAEVPCQQGYYSVSGQKSCTRCPAGIACTTSVGYSPVICEPGSYSLGGSATCEPCPAGSKCPNVDQLPEECPTGYYSEQSASDCTICPAGYYCQDPSQLPQICGVGTYSFAGSINCKTCQGGVVCASGANSPLDGTTCPIGSYCPPGTPQPVNCPAGTYGTAQGQAEIQNACTSCIAGKVCEQGSVDLTNANCRAGYYCPTGTRFSDEFPCPAGTYNSNTGRTSINDCLPCPEGHYCQEASTGFGTFNECPQGHYCPLGTTHAREFPCPAGTFNSGYGLKLDSECTPCPPGYYCRLGATVATPCPRGTYSFATSAISSETCIACPAGWACPSLAMTNPNEVTCSPGHYCPQGTAGPQDHPCPAGTYTDRTDLTNIGDCELCLAGTACEEGTGSGVKSPITCSQGYYCPGVASLSPPTYFKDINALGGGDYYTIPGLATGQSQFPCPPGTYGPNSGAKTKDECVICPEGSYCAKASSSISGSCAAGYFCPEGTSSPTQFPCPAGTYSSSTSLTDAMECIACPEGHYCPIHSTEPQECPSGSYASSTGTKGRGPSTLGSEKCISCPAGSSCPSPGEISPTSCGKGYYSIEGESSCHICPAGYFCPSETTSRTAMITNYVCPEGLYCPEGTSANLTDPLTSTDSFLCPTRHYCPAGAVHPYQCPPGTYSFDTGLKNPNDCQICTEGHYCLEGSFNATSKCEPGFFCPFGSTGPREQPCPAGRYSNYFGTTSADNCTICPAGFYCPPGTSEPMECPNGYYCHCGLGYPEPCPIGTYGASPGLTNLEGCTLCPSGQYCDGVGEVYPTGPCDPGYYCLEGAYTSQPPGPPTGGTCPRGGYCIQGSANPEACPLGTYNNFTGGKSEDDCVSCTPGYYCSGTNNPSPTGPCSAGYYCDGGAAVPTQHATPAGHYTHEGSSSPIPCPQGTYNPYTMQSNCTSCEAGFYCPDLGLQSRSTCPAGYYCPSNSVIPTPCPMGTFSSQENLEKEDDCVLCPAGKYCERAGLTEPSGDCAEGHYCTGGTIRSNPVSSAGDNQNGDLCPPGRFCPNGTTNANAFQCPPGTYSPSTGNKQEEDCLPCSPGYYCPLSGIITPLLQCDAGFYCISGSTSSSPSDGTTGDICPSGHYCPIGSSYPHVCPSKFYQTLSGQSTCDECPEGYYCDDPLGTVNPTICPPGYYCASKSSIPTPCPSGTFSNGTGLTNVTQCTLCSGGMFCSLPGQLEPLDYCDEGYFCTQGAVSSTGLTNPDIGGSGGLCIAGHYCPSGTALPKVCPPGTYSPSTGNSNLTLCLDCPPGFYCENSALTEPTGECEAGYYCIGGSASPTPDSSSSSMCYGSVGGRCPPGSYCETGSSSPTACPAGQYQDQFGQSSCKECPAGFFCNATEGTISPEQCLAGHYCPSGTGHFLPSCPAGSFSGTEGLSFKNECTVCLGGKFCSVAGLTEPNGDCLQGYYCTSGAKSQIGEVGELGGLGGLCPPGSYCPTGSSSPHACSSGYYSPSTGNTAPSDCVECPGGKYCSINGLSEPDGDCNAGCYCIGGSKSPCPVNETVGGSCPRGHYCLQHSVSPSPCDAGNYSSVIGKSQCDTCPEGSYCPPGTSDPLDCPQGRYCPSGIGNVIPQCPPGTFSNLTNLVLETQCTLCSGGKFCGSSGLTAPEGNCAPGYYCIRGALNNVGALGVYGGDSGICPKGSYCEEGSTIPSPCPLGTYSAVMGLGSADDCTPCTPGMYCDTPGILTPTGNCSAGYYCPQGQTTSSPSSYTCIEGHYCPSGSSTPVGCPTGTYQPATGASECLACPEGYFCSNNTIVPEICPSKFYCPTGTGSPISCPDGMYSLTSGLSAPEQCIPCPVGKWCTQGTIIGDCSAGYHCKIGSSTPTPSFLPGENSMGSLCPRGFYCLVGTVTPSQCPNGLFSDTLGAQDSSVCGPCLAGYMCFEGSSERYPCPSGRYCPMSEDIYSCPNGTYNPVEYAANSSSCIPCQEGYYCPDQAMSTYETYPCPIAHYCPTGSIAPTPCPAGTYRPEQFGASFEACLECPAGHYCPSTSSAPIECLSNTTSAVYCPAGSTTPSTCPSGKYCEHRTATPMTCPAGYYCPANTYDPIICPEAHFCPLGSSLPTICPFGYKIRTDLGVGSFRSSLEESCEACPAGTYGNHETRASCSPCGEGYYCETGATHSEVIPGISKNVYICPTGYYCVAGSSKPAACPVGHYQDEMGQINCKKCSAGQHNPIVGSSKCSICGPNAYSEEGAETCTCYGSNRVYQDSDRMCLCKPGYIFYNEDFSIGNDTDAATDCQPFIYDRCNTGSARTRDIVGNCVIESQACRDFCDGEGSINSELGLCECTSLVNEDEICDPSCRNRELQLTINRLEQKIQLTDPTTNDIISSYSFQSLTAGTVNCPLEECQVYPVQTTDKGFRGVYNANTNYYLNLLNHTMLSTIPISETRAIFENVPQYIEQSGILQPVVCLSYGSSLMWDISHPSRTHYPVYMKDALLNTVADFDYGPFRQLDALMRSNLTMTTFIYTFQKSGVFVFHDYSSTSRIMIVRVMNSTEACPSTATFKPITSTNLVTLGIKRRSEMLLAPDWILVVILLLGFLLFIAILIIGIHYFRTRTWKGSKTGDGVFRKLIPLVDIESKGIGFAQRQLFASKQKSDIMVDEDDPNIVDLEGFSVTTFYDKLNEHKDTVKDNMRDYQDEFLQKYNKVLEETKEIKDLLNNVDNKSGTSVGISMLMNDVPKATTTQNAESVIELLKSQRDKLREEKLKKIPFDPNNSDLDPSDVKKMYNLDLEEGKNRDSTINQYELLISRLEDRLADIQAIQNKDDIDSALDQFNKTLETSKLIIGKSLDKVNASIAEKNDIKRRTDDPFTKFNLSDDMAQALKDFLANQMRSLFDKYTAIGNGAETIIDSGLDPVSKDNTKAEEDDLDEALFEDSDTESENDNEEQQESEEIRALHQERKAQRIVLHHQQKAEVQQIMTDNEVKEANGSEQINTVLDDHAQKSLDQIKERTNTLVKSKELSTDERAAVLERGKKDMDDLKNRLSAEKQKQLEKLQNDLKSRAVKKLKVLKEAHKEQKELQKEIENENEEQIQAILKSFDANKNNYGDKMQADIQKQKELLKQKLELQRKNREKRQALEKEQLRKLLDNENEIDRKFESDRIDNLHNAIISQKTEDNNNTVKNFVGSKNAKDKLQKELDKELTTLKSDLSNKKQDQMSQFEEQLKAENSVKEQELEKKHALEEQADIKKQEAALAQLKKLMGVSTEQAAKHGSAIDDQKKRQAEQLAEKMKELARKRAQKLNEIKKDEDLVEKQIEEEAKKEQMAIEKGVEEDFKKKSDELKAQLEEDLKNCKSEEEREKLLSLHTEEMVQLSNSLERAKKNQMNDMERKLAERRLQMMKKLEDKKNKALMEELSKQDKDLDDLTKISTPENLAKSPEVIIRKASPSLVNQLDSKLAQNLENLQKSLADEEKKELENIAKESKELEKTLNEEKEAKKKILEEKTQVKANNLNEDEKARLLSELTNNISNIEKQYNDEAKRQQDLLKKKLEAKRKLLATRNVKKLEEEKSKQEEEKQRVLREEALKSEEEAIAATLSQSPLDSNLLEGLITNTLLPRQLSELEALDVAHAKQLQAADPQSHDELKLKHLDARVKLKEAHIEERKKLSEQFKAHPMVIAPVSDIDQLADEELKKFSKEIEKQKEENLKKIESQKQELKAKMQEELDRIKREMEEEKARLKRTIEDEKNKLSVKELMKEQELELQKVIDQQKNMAEDERHQLLAQHKSNMDAFESALEVERKRQDEILKARIEEIMNLKLKQKEAEANHKVDEEFDADIKATKQKQEEHVAKNALKVARSTMSLMNLISGRGKVQPSSLEEDHARPAIKNNEPKLSEEQAWLGPIYQKLKDIESLLLSEKRPYVDIRDQHVRNEGKLSEAPETSLSLKDLIYYKFGQFIIKLLRSKFAFLPEINLLIAKTLPITQYNHNAFKNSFFYDRSRNALFLRDSRLTNIGKLIILVVHCVAHIAIKDMSNDENPLFTKCFYTMLEVVCEDLFLNRQPVEITNENRNTILDAISQMVAHPRSTTPTGLGFDTNSPSETPKPVMTRVKSQSMMQQIAGQMGQDQLREKNLQIRKIALELNSLQESLKNTTDEAQKSELNNKIQHLKKSMTELQSGSK